MYVPGTEMHMVTFSIVLFELVILFFQLIYFLERPSDKNRLWYSILLFLLIQYNVLGGLFPDHNIPISITLQNILAYGSGVLMSVYFAFYLYRAIGLSSFRWFASYGMFYFVFLPFVAAFIIPYVLTGDLELSRKLLVVVPLLYCIVIAVQITRAVYKKYQEALQQQGEHLYRERIISVYLAFAFWLSLPVITYVDGGQLWEVCMTNAGFLVMTIAYVRSSVLNAKAEHHQLMASEKKLQKLNKELQQKVEERTRKLALMNEQKTNTFINLVHETKTPLTLINNYLDEYISRKGMDEDLAIIKYNTEKLTNDVVNLFDLQRLEKGLEIYDHEQNTNFTFLLENAIALFRSSVTDKDIFLKEKIESGIVLKASSEALSRITNNLIENAIKYTDRGGAITVKLGIEEHSVVFSVIDNGVGIPKHLQNKIFEPYFQINHAKNNSQGLGMGLSIVKKTVDSLQGALEVKSQKQKGTTITIRLPYIKSGKKPLTHVDEKGELKVRVTTPIPVDSLLHPEAPHLLLVEDNLSMLNYLAGRLKNQYNVYVAENGAVALRKLKTIKQLDLVITDVMMDVVDGYEFIKAANHKPHLRHIPFIFLTAKSTNKDRLKGLSLGAIDYIQKPFPISVLEHKINAVLANMERQKTQLINHVYKTLQSQPEASIQVVDEATVFEENCKRYQLSPREIEVADMVGKGKTHQAIGDELNISAKTVSKHVQNVFLKVKVNNKIDLMNHLKASDL